MQNYLFLIEKIKQKFPIPKEENFEPATSGTRHRVFISSKYVIRFRDNNSELLLREIDFLKQINHSLIPKVLWGGKVDGSVYMIENRLLGKNIHILWKTISETNKKNIIKQVIYFLQYLKTQIKDHIYSINTGKKYNNFIDYLTDDIKQKITGIREFKQTDKVLEDIISIIEETKAKNLFLNKETTLVHGDLIIHNLITDGENLTGVLDWELALFGDPDYDLSRLFYYQECAKAYQEQGIDETFEADYMDKLIKAILKSDLIKDRELFYKKYNLMRAIFYLNALYWASNSDNPEKNIDELIVQWNKKTKLNTCILNLA